ncbi:MAG: menaquinone biosynthesis protein [Desulfobulbaceae bacterium]|jgi:chorismate dehydratase|nr:menaquinone biosynthesis protein [Desulfobulbaceae bacterium]
MENRTIKTVARIGMVNFINTAPFYEMWLQTVARPEWQITEAVPTTLNKMLYAGDLDLGFISSHEYGLHPDLYKILGGLSISATGAVGSVFLFSQEPIPQLDGKKICLTNQSQTSVSLLKIILEDFLHITPEYVIRTGSALDDSACDAFLAIGDEALRLQQSGLFAVELDLSQTWHEHTGLPFVFAVWAVRKEFCQENPLAVVEIHQELQRCIQLGAENLPAICELVAPRIPMETAVCQQYLQKMEYDLSPPKIEALSRFFTLLIERNEIPAQCLPLEICE